VSAKVLYAFPPAALLSALISRIVKLGLRVVVVVPIWKQAEWWPLISAQPSIYCGKVADCIVAGEAGLCHPFGPSFDHKQALQTDLEARAMNL
jgi:hypothetical protein